MYLGGGHGIGFGVWYVGESTIFHESCDVRYTVTSDLNQKGDTVRSVVIKHDVKNHDDDNFL